MQMMKVENNATGKVFGIYQHAQLEKGEAML